MKFKKLFLGLLLAVISIFGVTVNAATSAPSSFNVRFSDLHLLDGKKYLNGASLHFYYKVNTAGKVIYCLDQDRDVPSGNPTVYYLKGELSAKYAYVLANGYPNKSLTGDNDQDYYITAMSIWYLANPNNSIFRNFDINKGTFLGKSNAVAKWMGILVNGANNYAYTTPSIKINNANSNMTLSSDGLYYVSGKMSVSTTGVVGNYTVSLNNAISGTIVTDVNGKAKNTFATNESFIVKVPAKNVSKMSNEFSVSVSANGTIDKAYYYAASNSRIQRTLALYPDNSQVNAKTNLNINLKTKVEISKVDATNSEELPGAKLTIKSADGSYEYSWISTDKPKVIEGLKPGDYILIEEKAPDGYSLSTETVKFTVKADGTVTKVKMENKLNTVYISKKDATTGEELPGATLVLKDSNGKVVDKWVSTKEPHMISGLKPGKYTLTETIAPKGYKLSTETVTFIVNEDGTVSSKVIMYNKPETIVHVPKTGTFKNITTSLIGLLTIGVGSILIYRNSKKNNEMV